MTFGRTPYCSISHFGMRNLDCVGIALTMAFLAPNIKTFKFVKRIKTYVLPHSAVFLYNSSHTQGRFLAQVCLWEVIQHTACPLLSDYNTRKLKWKKVRVLNQEAFLKRYIWQGKEGLREATATLHNSYPTMSVTMLWKKPTICSYQHKRSAP